MEDPQSETQEASPRRFAPGRAGPTGRLYPNRGRAGEPIFSLKPAAPVRARPATPTRLPRDRRRGRKACRGRSAGAGKRTTRVASPAELHTITMTHPAWVMRIGNCRPGSVEPRRTTEYHSSDRT